LFVTYSLYKKLLIDLKCFVCSVRAEFKSKVVVLVGTAVLLVLAEFILVDLAAVVGRLCRSFWNGFPKFISIK
jgi:hypothetical protein